MLRDCNLGSVDVVVSGRKVLFKTRIPLQVKLPWRDRHQRPQAPGNRAKVNLNLAELHCF